MLKMFHRDAKSHKRPLKFFTKSEKLLKCQDSSMVRFLRIDPMVKAHFRERFDEEKI